MARAYVLGLPMLLLVLVAGCTSVRAPVATPDQASGSELHRAVAIATHAAADDGYPLHEYTLTSARRIIYRGQYVWIITFKPNNLLPEDPSKQPLGLGGEIFVNVDLSTQKVRITFGE